MSVLDEKLRDLGRTVTDLPAMLGVPWSTVSRWLRGKARPGAENAEKLRKILASDHVPLVHGRMFVDDCNGVAWNLHAERGWPGATCVSHRWTGVFRTDPRRYSYDFMTCLVCGFVRNIKREASAK